MTQLAPARGWEHMRGWLVLLALPLLLIALDKNWILTYDGAADGWVYYGHFTNFQEYQRTFAGTYYVTRLAWLVPGALLHALLPAMAANYVLHLGVYYAAVFSIYFALRRVAGARVALLASMMVGCYAFFLGAVGWHYVDGAGLAYYAVALACLTAAIDSPRRRVWLAGAGAAFAGSFHTNIVWAIMLPALGYYYFVTTRESRTGRVLTDWMFALLGSAALTLFLAAVAVTNGGTFWFFVPSLAWALSPGAGYRAAAAMDLLTRVGISAYLLFPLVVLISSLCFRLAPRNAATPLARLAAEHYVLVCAALVVFDLAGGALLSSPFYVSYVIPGMALALGVLLRDAVGRLSTKQYVLTLCIVTVTFAVVLDPWIASRLPRPLDYSSPGTIVIAFLVVVVATVALTRLWTNVVTLALLLIGAGLVNVMTADGRLRQPKAHERDVLYRAIVAGSDALRTLDPGVSARFWYDERPPLGQLYLSVAATRMWGYRLFGNQFPSLHNPLSGKDAPVLPEESIIVLSEDDDALAKAQGALKKAGVDSTVVERRDIADESVRFHMFLLRTVTDQSLLEAPFLPAPSDVFLEGSEKVGAERVNVAREGNVIQVHTNRSTYDFQIVSRPIALSASRRYLAEFELDIPQGGAGVHVVSAKTRAVIASNYWCAPMRHPSRESFNFETGTDDSVRLVLSNCGLSPVVSDFTVRDLQLRAYRTPQ